MESLNRLGKRRVLAAVAASFFIYLVPLPGPHAVFLVGEHLWSDLFSVLGRRPTGWVLADCSVALAAQFLFGALCYWIFRRPRIRVALLVLAVPVLAVALNWLLQSTIPTHFLIEPNTAPEKSPWPQECVAQSASLATLSATAGAALAAEGEALVRLDDLSYGLLHVPGCTVTPLDLPKNAALTPVAVTAAGAVLAMDMRDRDGKNLYWYSAPAGSPTAIDWLPGPSRYDGSPILSTDGTAAVWVRMLSDREPPLPSEVRIEAIDRSYNQVVSLGGLAMGTWVPLAFDRRAGQLLLACNLAKFVIIGLDGKLRWGPFTPEGVSPQPQTFLRLDDKSWFAWDAYRDEAPYRLAWSFAGPRGGHTILKGYAVESAAVRPSGDYAAYSATCSYSLGDFSDFISVLRTSDGAEVLRKRLRRYTRTMVAFLDGGFFAYSEVEGAHMVTRVLRIPQ